MTMLYFYLVQLISPILFCDMNVVSMGSTKLNIRLYKLIYMSVIIFHKNMGLVNLNRGVAALLAPACASDPFKK